MNNSIDSKLLPTYEELLKQGYTDRLNTLSLRFIEGPKDDLSKLPFDLRCGTILFSQDPRVQEVYDSGNEFRLITFNLSTERLVSLNENLTNLKLQVHDAEKNCMHLNSTDNDPINKIVGYNDDTISRVNNTMSAIVNQVFQLNHLLTREKKKLNTGVKKLQHWVASQAIQSAEHERYLNRCNVLSNFNSNFHLASLYIRNREPRLFHSILRSGETIQLKKPSVWPPKNFSKFFGEPIKRFYKPWNFHEAIQIAVNAIPYICESPSLTNLSQMEKCTSHLAALQNELEKSHDECHDHLKHKYHILVEKIRKSIVMQSYILNQCQHIRNEEISVYNTFPFLTSAYEVCLLNLLGQGAFAEVWKCFDTKTFQVQAIKIINIDMKSSAQDKNFILLSTYQEATLQKNLKHPHVVEMQRCFDVSQTTFVFILDLCNGGTLYDYLQKNGPLTENLAKQWMYQLLLGLHYIHKNAYVVHFDIKPSNILLHNNQIKISDFGLHHVNEYE
ncbi:serine/threonine-protein kinase tousled-like 1-B isoform X2 [Hylaeus volcanicus]|uniref:serine/threonine-protein kinase tousled-like 1-B isoform X2 n=1 Tax=Hylaeus volcanicus TaxID=313075 RepID=UPI0023B83308|nr:serine/threonine-protein kinase tousled-like 1-B isoform X2 [Hylaeus volcanicus]